MRRLVSIACLLALTACGGVGAARTAVPPASADTVVSDPGTGVSDAGRVAGRPRRIIVTPASLSFTATGWDATQVVKTTWRDDSRKTATTSDPFVATVSPPFQQAQWIAPRAFGATYYVTPVGPGTATITFSDHDGAESAKLSVTVVGPPNQTLYIGGVGEVDAIPAASNGVTVPQRRITGFYQPLVPGSSRSGGAGPAGVAPDGTLYVLHNYQVAQTGQCDAVVEAATANGFGGALGTFSCYGSRGYGVAPGRSGEVDVLVSAYSGGAPVVKRFVSGQLQSSLTAPGNRVSWNGLATDAAANIFVSTQQDGATITGQITEYASGGVDGDAPVRTIAAPANGYFGPIAVAPDGTIYAAFSIPNYTTGGSTDSVYAFAPGASSPSRTIGPFGTDPVVALAVDRGGELYIALSPRDRPAARVDVYAPDATGSAAPIRRIPSPIAPSAPGGPAIGTITLGPPQPLAPEQVLGRIRRQ